MQGDGHHFAGGAAVSGQVQLNLLQLHQLFRPPEVEQGAHGVGAAHAGAEEAQAHGLTHHQAKLLGVERHFGAFFHTKRGQAQRGHRRLHAGDGGHVALHTHVVTLRRAAPDAHTPALAHVAVIGSAARHGQVKVGPVEQARGLCTVGCQPAVDDALDTLLDLRRLQHTAVEQDGRGVQEGRTLGLCALQAVDVLGRPRLARQKRGEVAGDGGVLCVGQAELGQRGAGAGLRLVGNGNLGEETFHQHGQHLGAGNFGADAAANEFASPAGHHHGHGLQCVVGQQLLFGAAAAVRQRAGLPGVELFALPGQLARHAVGQRQVHVVATEQDVLAHSHTLQRQVAITLQHGDEGQVGSAAAHIHDEDDVAVFHLLAPVATAGLDPAVQRGLRLFKQREVLVTRCLAGLGRQLARGRVERCGNGDGDVLRIKRGLGVGLVPGPAQVRQVTDGGGQRRHTRHLGRRIGGQQRCAAVDTGVAQPAFGAADQADRCGRAPAAGEFAHHIAVGGTPGQDHVGSGQLTFVGQVQKRGQQRLGVHTGRPGELGNVQHALRHRVAVTGAAVYVRQGAVGGAQVNSNAITGCSARCTCAFSYQI